MSNAVKLAAGTEIGERDRVSLVYADREFLDPKFRAFVDFFVEWVGHRGRGSG